MLFVELIEFVDVEVTLFELVNDDVELDVGVILNEFEEEEVILDELVEVTVFVMVAL